MPPTPALSRAPSWAPSWARLGTVTRRATLGGAAALTAVAVAGCTDDAPRRTVTPPPTRRAGTDPDVLLAATVLADERAMLERVKATARRHPTLKARPRGRAGGPPGPRAAAGPGGAEADGVALPLGVRHPVARPSPGVPAKPGPALAALAQAEDRLSHVGRRSAFAARSGAFARVLASMAAAATQQAAAAVGGRARTARDPAAGAAADAGRRARRRLRVRRPRRPGLVVGRSRTSRGGCASAYAMHRGRRDQLTAMVRDADGDPVAAAGQLRRARLRAVTAAQLDAAARVIEQRCAASTRTRSAAPRAATGSGPSTRCTDAAVRELSFGGAARARSPASAEL